VLRCTMNKRCVFRVPLFFVRVCENLLSASQIELFERRRVVVQSKETIET